MEAKQVIEQLVNAFADFMAVISMDVDQVHVKYRKEWEAACNALRDVEEYLECDTERLK